MWKKKPLNYLLLTSLWLGFTVTPSPAQSAENKAAENCEQQSTQPLHFVSGEGLFTVLAWLNWVTEHDADFKPENYDPVQTQLFDLLKTLPPALRQKHREAYEAYLTGADDYSKNGLLILDSQYYGAAPQFALKVPQKLSEEEAYRLQQLPPATVLQEFYQALDLGRHWKTTFAPVFAREQAKYREAIEQGAQRAHCLLKLSPTAPVDVIVNPLDAFGTAGQTSYNAHTKRFLIKLHVDAKNSNTRRVADTAAHEYTHALMNKNLAPFEAAFRAKIQAIEKGVGDSFPMPLQEQFAQSVGYLSMAQNYPDFIDNIIYYNKNLLFPTFLSESKRWQAQSLEALPEIPRLIEAIDVPASQALWQKLAREKNEP